MNLHPLRFALQTLHRAKGWLLPLVLLVLLGTTLMVVAKPDAAGRVAAGVGALAAVLIWCHVNQSLVNQNRLRLAQLVPGQAQHLRRIGVASGLLVGGLTVALLTLISSRPPVELALAVSAMLLLFGWVQALPATNPWLNAALVMTMTVGLGQSRHWLPWVREWVASLGPFAWALVLLLLAAPGLMLCHGGKRHAQSERLREQAKRLQADPWHAQGWFGGAGKKRPAPLLNQAWSRLRTAAPLRRVAWLLLRPLSPVQTGLRSLGTLLGVGALTLVAMLVLGIDLSDAKERPGGAMLVSVLTLMFWAQGWWSGRLHATRRDQALLLLLPGVPRGPALARAWWSEALRMAVLGGLAALLPATLLVLLMAPAQLGAVAVVALLASPALLGALRHPAGLRESRGIALVPLLILVLPLMALWPALAWPLAGITVAVTLVGGWLLMPEPQAAEPFPAGRLAATPRATR
jgi:hypothetical protein